MYKIRVSQLTMDHLLSSPLAPPLEISPLPLLAELNPNSATFAIISEKNALLTHHLYPFIAGRGDYSVNIVAVHTSWLIQGSNLAKRAILYNEPTNSFIEAELNSPIFIDCAYLVELFKDKEVQTHANLNEKLELVNPAGLSKARADDKLWLRQNKPAVVNTPGYLLLTKKVLSQEGVYTKLIESFLAESPKGVVVQARANTTEGELVGWFGSSESGEKVFGAVKEVFEALDDTDVVVSEFRGNLVYNGARVVFRFNVCCENVTVAAYVGQQSKGKSFLFL